jgi:retinol dehydrogenase 12
MTNELSGKIILMTGATEGIGKAAAQALAQKGATLVLVGRNPAKTEKVVAEIKSASGNASIETIIADLSQLSGMRAVAAAFKAKHNKLDVLVNNAGGVFTGKQLTADGFEYTFALNHMSYFVLTHELIDVLAKTPGARVVSTSSGAHRSGKLANLDEAAHRKSGYSSFGAYGDSKLANILFTRELSRRVRDTGIVANCFHPGFVRTGFGLNNTGTMMARFIGLIGPVFGRTPEKGAETLVWLASSPDAARFSGEYFHDLKVSSTTSRAKNDELAKQLWAFSEKLAGIA